MSKLTKPNAGPQMTPARLREARRAMVEGEAGSAELAACDPALIRSWERSQAAGLSPLGRASGTPHASALQLAQARAQQHELIAHARPAMEFVDEQTRDTDSIVLLSDAQGLLLDTLGDASFANRMKGEGLYADLLAQRFAIALKRYGLQRLRPTHDVSQFRPPLTVPAAPRADDGQGQLFG